MTRNLKAMGLAVVALLATGAVFASPAAARFEAESTPVTLTVSSNGMQKLELTPGASAIECTTLSLDNSTISTSPTTTVEVFPTYTNCERLLALTTTVSMNGCGYLLHSAAGSTTGTVDVTCPSGKAIEINVGSTPFCQYTLGPTNNQGLGTVVFSNQGSGTTREVRTEATVTGITATRTINGFGCPDAKNSVYRGSATITGENASGHVGVFVD
jgi:hypothetical protein